MRGLRKWVWAVLAATAATPAIAQQSTSVSGGGLGGANSGSTLGGSISGSGSSGGGSSSGGLGGSGSSSGSGSNPALQTMQAAPKLTAPSGTANSSLASSNGFGGYYANPYYQGLITAQTNATPGGFGSPLYGNSTSGTGGVNRGTTGTNRSSGVNGQNTSQQSGILIPIQVQINYSAQMQFPTPPVAAGRMQADLRGAIDSSITNPKGVQVITDANNNVVLRGSVKDDEEARLVEGLVRITPGVGAIRNELTAATPATGTASASK